MSKPMSRRSPFCTLPPSLPFARIGPFARQSGELQIFRPAYSATAQIAYNKKIYKNRMLFLLEAIFGGRFFRPFSSPPLRGGVFRKNGFSVRLFVVRDCASGAECFDVRRRFFFVGSDAPCSI